MQFTKVSTRVLVPLAGAALATVTAVAPASAAPEHWVAGEVQYAGNRTVLSPHDGTQGSRILVRVDWEADKGGVYGNMWDLKKDGNDARLEAGYSWLSGGTWKPVTRTLNTVADSGDTGVHTSLHTDPNVKIKDLKVRTCTVNSAGAYVWCGAWY
ncbi:hypothetical protein GCM10018785_20260 [Streptomyces longispororuber]|uniref:Secreted protein n=1 Tax=Streptomyces longispororuber TaxID=68230 RepID=A0A919DKA5_9ACTN|nr:hypothetical protein [Streptomyces longispororuber]GHE50471.1 hypothetical protein GCM10018785_20260 [Streptomyces longispororuber]